MNKMFLFLLGFLYCTGLFAQNDNEVLFTYGANATPVTVKEFLTVYKKNNMGKEVDFKEASLRDYLNLYENFKIKVAEGKAQKIDTLPQLKSELANYRKQLAKNYLVDKELLEKMYKEVYDRSNTDVHVAHIVLKCAPDASPKDTLAVYQKMQKIRERLVTGKEDFATVAKEVSEDPSVKTNGGDLGYITALQSFYAFENAAYSTPAGAVSGIFRTKVGYHIVKVISTRPSRGQVLCEHILVATARSSTKDMLDAAQNKINRFASYLKSGRYTFEDLARDSSDDHTSAQNDGKLPWFGAGKMVPEFEEAAFALNNINDVSAPIKSDYGYHIIRLLGKKQQDEYAKSKDDIKRIVDRDVRFDEAKKAYLLRVRKENKFTENKVNYAEFVKGLDSALLKQNFRAATLKAAKPLMTIGNKSYTTNDFAVFMEGGQHNVNRKNVNNSADIADRLYATYVDKVVLDYAENNLENKYPDFKNLITEYGEGIVLFEITDRNVWTKAVSDTTGLKAYYQNHAAAYKWGPRLQLTSYKCGDPQTSNLVSKLLSGKTPASTDSIRKAVNMMDKPGSLYVESGKFEKSQQTYLESAKWEKGVQTIFKDGMIYVLNITDILDPSNKTLEEARGYVIADYQETLEKDWLAALKSKYPIKENTEVFKKLVKP